jgi:AmiR/NasT family two-component response regulator
VNPVDEALERFLPPTESAGETGAQAARDSRIVIEQAKGILAERYRLSVDEAFDLMRKSARDHRMRLHALAAAVISSQETPPEISPPGLVR